MLCSEMNVLQCHIEVVPEADILSIRGEVDTGTISFLRESLQPIIGNGRHVIVDMSELRYIDGSGLRVLALAHQRSAARGMQVLIAAPSPFVRRVLEIVSLDGAFSIFATVGDALKRLRGMSTALRGALDQGAG
jgi:anti-sigma B factor antagonist